MTDITPFPACVIAVLRRPNASAFRYSARATISNHCFTRRNRVLAVAVHNYPFHPHAVLRTDFDYALFNSIAHLVASTLDPPAHLSAETHPLGGQTLRPVW